MEQNCKSKFNLDHVYCHTNTVPNDVAILKENKQLKAMLLLHLDLIQEQSDQLMTKDKLLASLREENETLKQNIERMNRRLQLKNNKSPESPIVINNNDIKKEEIAPEGSDCVASQPIIVSETETPPVENNQISIESSVGDTTTLSTSGDNKYKICGDENFGCESIIGENNGKFISKIILQRVMADEQESSPKSDFMECESQITFENYKDHKLLKTIAEESSNQDDVSMKTEQNHHIDTEDSFSCGSGDQDRTVSRPLRHPLKHVGRLGFMTAKRPYCLREWEIENIDEEINKDETEALKADAPNLEIPKWTIKEFTGLYSIEGTEDLSDDTFLKRHAKLEYDEKRRKKWDVQRIREQRTIERLKRRHCKDELQEAENNVQDLSTFFPTPESIKFIQITDELPVNAFGESIPLSTNEDFNIPWQELMISQPNASHRNTSVLLMKKRRRQYSQSNTTRRPYKKLVIKNN